MKASQRDSVPQVFLNHFYVVLDSPTYKAIERNGFLRKRFAVNEKRTTTNAEMSYTGLYFYGINTYFSAVPGHANSLVLYGHLKESAL